MFVVKELNTKCDHCQKDVAKICGGTHATAVCEACHKALSKECIETWGAAGRDNTDCRRVEISIQDRKNEL